MCGLVGGFQVTEEALQRAMDAIAHRGPDARGVAKFPSGLRIGHVRLSVVDAGPASDQPFRRGNLVLAYNGELWNYRELREQLEQGGAVFLTQGDTEVFAAMLEKYGVNALPRMQGMWAVAWTQDGETLHLARDRFGEIPLHAARSPYPCFGSEVKGLLGLGVPAGAITWVEPGRVVTMTSTSATQSRWYAAPVKNAQGVSREEAAAQVRGLLRAGVTERTIGDDAPCVLLSGGVDSSFVTAALAQEVKAPVAYTAVMDRQSPDLKAARQVASALGIELREVPIPEPTSEDLAETVARIEMPHKAQVEIAWACVQLAAAIRADGFKVVLSGEGSDELWGSYGFAYHALKTKGWREYRQELFIGQHRKNFARCNKVFMAKSVECRLPFLSTPLVEYALSLPRETVCDKATTGKELMNAAAAGVVPDFVRKRSKMAFQDGAGLKVACAKAVADPKRFYRIAFEAACHGVAA